MKPYHKRREYRGLSPLLVSVLENDHDECDALIKSGYSIDDVDVNDDSLLSIASRAGYDTIVALFIKHHADLNSRNVTGCTAVNIAVDAGHTVVVQQLIKAGSDLDIGGENGRVPLHTAVMRGRLDLVGVLLDGGCNKDCRDRDICTALMYAVWARDDECLQTIIHAGCDLNVQDKQGQTALYHAAVMGYLEGVKALLSAGCDVNLPKTYHDTPLIACIRGGHFVVATEIAKAGCDVNKPGHQGNTAIHAALNKMYEMCGPMVNYGLIPNFEGVKLVEALVAGGCDLGTIDSEGRSPLYQAASLSLFELSHLLLKKGCSLSSITKSGDSVLHGAIRGKHPAIVELFLQSGCEVNIPNNTNETCLYRAVASWADIKIVELLLNAGSVLDVQESTNHDTALLRAIMQNRAEIALLLIDAGCDILLENSNREDAIYLCCLHGNASILTRLSAHPAFTPITPKLSRLPTHAAVSKSHVSLVPILMQCGADLNQVDSNGRSVIQLAVEENNLPMTITLLTYGADPEAHSLISFRRCCINSADPHPHFDLEPLFICMKHQNIGIMREVLNGYYIPPRRVIRYLATILRGSAEVQAHYPPEMRRDILQLFARCLCKMSSLQRLCVGVIRESIGEGLYAKVERLGLPRKMCDLITRRVLLTK